MLDTTFMRIETYQYIEKRMSEIKFNKNHLQNGMIIEQYALGEMALPDLEKYDYVVCDECHYFFTDSNYNTKTQLSFDWISRVCSSKIQIFLSATIGDIKKYIKQCRRKMTFDCTILYRLPSINTTDNLRLHYRPIKEYEQFPNYDYLEVDFFENRSDVIDLVTGDIRGKWLIFVDDISYGIKIRNEIKDRINMEIQSEEEKY